MVLTGPFFTAAMLHRPVQIRPFGPERKAQGSAVPPGGSRRSTVTADPQGLGPLKKPSMRHAELLNKTEVIFLLVQDQVYLSRAVYAEYGNQLNVGSTGRTGDEQYVGWQYIKFALDLVQSVNQALYHTLLLEEHDAGRGNQRQHARLVFS